MPRIKDQAVCIRHLDWSETSQIVALLTREHGLVRGLAKGSKRTSPGAVARYSGGIELLTLGEAVGMLKSTAALMTVTEWDLQDPFRHLRRELPTMRLGLYAVDLVGAFLQERDPHPRTFDALATYLNKLAEPPRQQPALLAFQWALLDDTGFRPELDRDAESGEALADGAPLAFDAQAGGLVDARPRPAAATDAADAGPWRVRRETAELLRRVRDGQPVDDPAMAKRANRLLCVYARALLDRELPTMRFVLS